MRVGESSTLNFYSIFSRIFIPFLPPYFSRARVHYAGARRKILQKYKISQNLLLPCALLDNFISNYQIKIFMKNLFKTLVICGLFAWICGLTTSCTPDAEMGPPKFEITGDLKVEMGDGVNTPAISATLPVISENIPKIYYILREREEGAEKPQKPRKLEIQYQGKEISGKLEALTLTSGEDGLLRGKTYDFYFIVAISDMKFLNEDVDPVFAYEFETPDSYTNNDNPSAAPMDMMVLGTSYEGAKLDFMFPQAVKERGNKVKWGVTNIAHYNMYKLTRGQIDVDFTHRNENMYPNALISGDTVIDICHNNAYRMSEKYPGKIGYYYATYDENKNPVVKEVPEDDPMVTTEGSASAIQYYYLPAPGEPLVVLFTECGYSTCDLGNNEDKEGANAGHNTATCEKVHPTINYNWGPGWYWYPYDYSGYIEAKGYNDPEGLRPGDENVVVNEDDYWLKDENGNEYYHKKYEIRAKQPTEFKGTVNVETLDLTPDSAVIRFTPDKSVYAYCVGVFPADLNLIGEDYASITREFFDYDASLWQWFSTSEFGMYYGFVPYYNNNTDGKPDVIEVQLADDYILQAGEMYWVILTAVGAKYDENGEKYPDLSSQNFVKKPIRIPAYTKDAPELEVTAYDLNDPHKVRFNIKNPNYTTNKVESVAYAANYTREFKAYLQQKGATYAALLEANRGYAGLTAAELKEVNSADGYDMEIPYLRDGQSFTLAVMGWNDESRPSDPDAEGSKAVATAETPLLPAVPRLDGMDKLESLTGEWTATATMRTYDWEKASAAEEGAVDEVFYTEEVKQWKVTIGDLKTNETLSEEERTKLAALGVENVDEAWAEFKEQEKVFNDINLGQNRVLCQGWDLDSNEENMSLATTTPYDLMFSSVYSASQTSYLFNDFGPKWFLQVNENGDVFVPVNYEQVPPFTRWYSASNHYLVSGNFEHGYSSYIGKDRLSVEEVSIPVEISEDGNTITLKSTDIEYKVEKEDQTVEIIKCKGYPNIMFDYSTKLAFYNPYIVSEVVLTKGWTEQTPEVSTPEISTSALRYPRQNNSKHIINSADYKTPVKIYTLTPISHKNSGGKVTRVNHKILTRKDILNNFENGYKGKYWLAR